MMASWWSFDNPVAGGSRNPHGSGVIVRAHWRPGGVIAAHIGVTAAGSCAR
jgi:hypothetical protein